jgi:hypothetical protein
MSISLIHTLTQMGSESWQTAKVIHALLMVREGGQAGILLQHVSWA